MTILLAVAIMVAWGTWLLPAQGLPVSSQVLVFYTSVANLLVAVGVLAVAGMSGPGWPGDAWGGMIFGGGVLWALGCVCAFRATALLGPGRAMGIWAPVNILVSLAWGGFLFGEFSGRTWRELTVVGVAVVTMLVGMRLLFSLREDEGGAAHSMGKGLGWAMGAGVLWGSYFIPQQMGEVSAWTAALPWALGSFLGVSGLLVFKRECPRTGSTVVLGRLLAGGVLWSAGNYSALLLMERWGTGRGFSVAQLCLVVNALLSIWLFRRPVPGTSAARRVAIGCAGVTLGGVLLGFAV